MWLFVTPHALQQFKDRIAELSDTEIYDLINNEASKGRWILEYPQREPILQGYYCDLPFYIVIGEGKKKSLSVITILNMNTPVHYKLCRKRSRKMYIPLEELESHLRSCIAQRSH